MVEYHLQCDVLCRQTTVLQRHVGVTFRNITVWIVTSSMGLVEWPKFFFVWMRQMRMMVRYNDRCSCFLSDLQYVMLISISIV